MDAIEAKAFFANSIEPLWDTWEWNEKVLERWFEVLQRYKNVQAQQAINDVYEGEIINFQSHLIPAFLRAVKANLPKSTQTDQSDVSRVAYTLEMLDDEGETVRTVNIYTSKPATADELAEAAERDRARAETLYGGRWIIPGQHEDDPF